MGELENIEFGVLEYYTKYDVLISYGILCHYGTFWDDIPFK